MADFGKIRDEGAQAHQMTANPYPNGTSSAAAWLAGWTDSHESQQTAADHPNKLARHVRYPVTQKADQMENTGTGQKHSTREPQPTTPTSWRGTSATRSPRSRPDENTATAQKHRTREPQPTTPTNWGGTSATRSPRSRPDENSQKPKPTPRGTSDRMEEHTMLRMGKGKAVKSRQQQKATARKTAKALKTRLGQASPPWTNRRDGRTRAKARPCGRRSFLKPRKNPPRKGVAAIAFLRVIRAKALGLHLINRGSAAARYEENAPN
jgi:hypothetical protein